MISAAIKMVIWDLDDTFWRGTLAEGGVVVPKKHVAIVETLSHRGIVSSICSKNSFRDAQRVLKKHGAWPYFVFPQIEYSSKGTSIRDLIERMNLRPDNVLFIDDNPLNLEEARYFAPSLMTARPGEILPTLLELPQARGKADPGLSRLRQYKLLEQKFKDRRRSPLGAEDFLRSCDIRVSIDIRVEPHLERIFELINRSNQLNFTKVPVETAEEKKAFEDSLRDYGIHAGIVRASDKYGDHGIVGFFLMNKRTGTCELRHFVFSCRILNMGIEQYVYELLGKPRCGIVPPVANGLDGFARIDWIRPPDRETRTMHPAPDAKLLLLGGCDLMQVATYCSANRVEYVNRVSNEVMVRYDDPGFILSPRDAVVASTQLPTLPCWTGEDAVKFDLDLADSRTIIASMWEALQGDFILLEDHVLLRLAPRFLGAYFKFYPDQVRLPGSQILRLTKQQKLLLMARSLDRIAQISAAADKRFLLGTTTHRTGRYEHDCRKEFNRWAEAYCEANPAFEFVPIDEIVPKDEYFDASHLTRKGYFSVAAELLDRLARSRRPARTARVSACAAVPDFGDIVRSARVVRYRA